MHACTEVCRKSASCWNPCLMCLVHAVAMNPVKQIRGCTAARCFSCPRNTPNAEAQIPYVRSTSEYPFRTQRSLRRAYRIYSTKRESFAHHSKCVGRFDEA